MEEFYSCQNCGNTDPCSIYQCKYCKSYMCYHDTFLDRKPYSSGCWDKNGQCPNCPEILTEKGVDYSFRGKIYKS